MTCNTILFCVFASSIIQWFFVPFATAGSPCPDFRTIRPSCFCSINSKNHTLVVCHGIKNSSELEETTAALKSMIIDRLILLHLFKTPEIPPMEENVIDIDGEGPLDVNGGEKLPKHWLSSLRVREIEIQDSDLSNCFLCNEPLSGQGDFLTSLAVTHSNLEGHLCLTCNTKIKSVTTRELQKTPKISHVDLSFNNLEVLSGYAFPQQAVNLKTLLLSNNKISKIHDNAFSYLVGLQELDLSRNMLTSISKKIFRSNDESLKVLDLSWNSILTIPEDMFNNLRGLKDLKLNNNLLEVLHANTWTRLPLVIEQVDLKGNFIVCNCSISWISTTRSVSKSTRILGRCASPSQVEFQEIKSTLSTLQGCR